MFHSSSYASLSYFIFIKLLKGLSDLVVKCTELYGLLTVTPVTSTTTTPSITGSADNQDQDQEQEEDRGKEQIDTPKSVND
jgi:hypothetical protein